MEIDWDSVCHDSLVHIFACLLPTEIGAIALVCRSYLQVANSPALWEQYCWLHKGLSFKPPHFSWKQLYFTDTSSVCSHLSSVKYSNLTQILTNLELLYNEGDALKCQGSPDCPHRQERLWACLECPHAGCGRRFNGHALQHYNDTGHVLSIKLQTLEPSCYICQQWLGEEGRHEVERCRVKEIQNWLTNATPLSLRGFFLDPQVKKRRAEERALTWPDEKDEVFALIALDWFETWLAFIVGDTTEPSSPIDNTKIFDFSPDDPKVTGEAAFITVHQWDTLQKIYGGGPRAVYHRPTGRWFVGDGDIPFLGS